MQEQRVMIKTIEERERGKAEKKDDDFLCFKSKPKKR
jgi:hypothetical protein